MCAAGVCRGGRGPCFRALVSLDQFGKLDREHPRLVIDDQKTQVVEGDFLNLVSGGNVGFVIPVDVHSRCANVDDGTNVAVAGDKVAHQLLVKCQYLWNDGRGLWCLCRSIGTRKSKTYTGALWDGRCGNGRRRA